MYSFVFGLFPLTMFLSFVHVAVYNSGVYVFLAELNFHCISILQLNICNGLGKEIEPLSVLEQKKGKA